MRKRGRSKALLAMFLAAATLQAGTAFGAQTTTGSQLQAGTWVKEEAGWKFRKPSGEMATGWIQTASGWYYLQPETGIMATGMLRMNDRTYYFNANPDALEGKMTTGWYQDAKGSWYFFSTTADSTEGAAVTGWQWVDGRSYYFEPTAGVNHGKMFANGVTPDGYKVNADGQWVDENGKVQVVEGKGYASDPAKNKSTGTTVRSGNGGGGGGSSRSNSSSSNTGSDTSDNNNAGNNNNSNNTNNSNNNNNNDNNNDNSSKDDSNNNADQTKSVFVKEDETKLVEVNSLGWWITVAFEDGYNAGNTKVYADGVDVTAALSNVTDDGSICKLAVIKPPSELTVSNAADAAKTQTVSLDDEAANGVIYTGTNYLPEKILTHGPVALWDYYLTNYADDGSVRYSPSKTTFALGEKPVAHPAYSPDAELDENGKATVTIMFNYNTDEEKEWFDGVNRLQLVEYGENKNTIIKDLQFAAEKDVAHGSGKVGELTIETGQPNFTSNGRYYVRVISTTGTSSTSALVPIHVVNATAPVLKLADYAMSGVNLHFEVENMVYGITTPINRVVLEGPTGTVELNKSDDWFLFSQDLFVLYNDNENHLKYNGKYKLTIYADGFKETSVSFSVSDGEKVPSKDELDVAQYSFDGVSTASVGSGGSSSGSGESGSGSMAISANLVFDTDLLVNAELLEEIGKSTTESEVVADWWYGIVKDAVFDGSSVDEKYYKYSDYVNSVMYEKTTSDRFLTFEEYKKNGYEWTDGIGNIKEVLEDGLLGEIVRADELNRPEADAFTIVQNTDGNDVVLGNNADYLNAITKIVINDNWTALGKDDYAVDTVNGTLTLKKNLFEAGKDYKILVEATGYRSNILNLTYSVVVENDLQLTVKYPEGADAYTATEKKLVKDSGYYADATVEVTGSEGYFLKYANKADSIKLDGNTVLPKGQGGNDSVYYVIADDYKSIIIGNITPGDHVLTIYATGYSAPLTADIKVVQEEDNGEVSDYVPVAESLVYYQGYGSDYYYLAFDKGTTPESLVEYLGKVSEVTVDGEKYESGQVQYGSKNAFRPYVADITFGTNVYDILQLSIDSGFTGAEDSVEITITAEGYNPFTVTAVKSGDKYVLKSSEVVPPVEETKDAPKLSGQVSLAEGNKLEMTVEAGNEDYLAAIKTIKAGDENLTFTYEGTTLTVNTDELAAGEHTLTIEATGYTSQEIEVSVMAGDNGDDGDNDSSEVSDIIDFTDYTAESSFGNVNVYRILFKSAQTSEEKKARYAYLRAVEKASNIEVGTVTYKYSTLSYHPATTWFTLADSSSKYNSDYDCIYLSTDGLDSDEIIKIVIHAGDDYDDFTFYVKAGELVNPDVAEQELAEALEKKEAEVVTVEVKEETPAVDETTTPSQNPTESDSTDESKEDDTTASDEETPSVTPSESEETKDAETEPSEEDKDESKDESADESKDDTTEEPETPSETEDGSEETEDSKEDASEDNNSEDLNEDVSEDTASDDASEETEATETEGEI